MKIVKCLDCGEEKKHHAKGRCIKCYRKIKKPGKIFKCPDCNQEKKYYCRGRCRNCYSQIPEIKNKKINYDNNPENKTRARKLYKINNNRPEIKLRRKNYLREYNKQENRKKIRKEYRKIPENKLKVKETKRIYKSKPENRKKINKRRKIYNKEKRKNDINFKLIGNLRSRNCLALKGKLKTQTCIESLGCSPEFFKNHIISQFEPRMSIENYGEWVMDHDIPFATAKTGKEIHKLNHYTNIKPMWKEDNTSKGAKLDWVKSDKK